MRNTTEQTFAIKLQHDKMAQVKAQKRKTLTTKVKAYISLGIVLAVKDHEIKLRVILCIGSILQHICLVFLHLQEPDWLFNPTLHSRSLRFPSIGSSHQTKKTHNPKEVATSSSARSSNWFLSSSSPKHLLGFLVSALVGWWGFSHTANCAPNKGSLFGLFHVTTKQFGHSHMLESLYKWSVATCKMLCCPNLFFLSSSQPSSTAAPLNRLPPIGPGRQTLKLFCMTIHTLTDSSEMEI